MLKKPEIIQQVYNDGLVELIKRTQKTDDYGTPIGGVDKVTIDKVWFRDLSLTATDTFYAHADDTDLTSKIAVRGKMKISTKWLAVIDDTEHEIYRTYYNPKNKETEISLMEVSDE